LTYNKVNPYIQAFFAGYLEGRMTANETFDFYDNLRRNKNGDTKNKTYKTDFDLMVDFFKEV